MGPRVVICGRCAQNASPFLHPGDLGCAVIRYADTHAFDMTLSPIASRYA